MKQLSFQFEGFQPANANFGDKPAVLSPIKVSQIKKINLTLLIERALTHRTAVGGVALMGGMVLATGADTIPQALLTLAAFMVAGVCLHEKEEKGGEA